MPSRRFTILIVLFVTVVVNYLDRTNISIAAIGMTNDLGLGKVETGLVFSAFAWTYSLCQIPGGFLADKVRARTLYPVLLALWSVVTILQGFAGTIGLLIVCRAMLGLFEAPSYPINNRIATTWFPSAERAGAIGFYTSGQFLGLAVLAPILVAFQASFGWRALFYVSGTLGLVWAGVFRWLYRDPDSDPRVSDEELVALRAGGAAIDPDGEIGGHRERFDLSELVAAFRHRKLWGIYIGQFCIGSVSIFFLTWFPTYLVEDRGISFDQIGFTASVPFIAALAGVVLSGVMSDWMVRRGVSEGNARKGPVLVGLALSAGILGSLIATSDFQVLFFMSLGFFGNGMASISWVFVSLLAPPEQLGLVGGVFNFIGGLSAVVTPVVIGYLIDGHDFSRGLIYVGLVALGGIFSYAVLVGRLERVSFGSNEERKV
ncbi:MFS transporter [Tsuneonella mangrovi]|uniref:MFS transporter n=1 Tax=Tsuneonella mangrovi TaxID=1982042 RepID=UPI000BA22081|nr:MFS transporter [Tsuneonella mangrovi]